MSDERLSDEQWYDEEIAPKLKEIADACAARKRSFLASVQFDAHGIGHTIHMEPDASVAMQLLHICIRSRDNLDAFMMNVNRWATESGVDTSQSIVMRLLFNPSTNR